MIEARSFYAHWDDHFACARGSHIAVLVSSNGDWGALPLDFRIAFGMKYQIRVFSWDMEGDRVHGLQEWEPRFLAAAGRYHFLQGVCRLRQRLLQHGGHAEDGLGLALFPLDDSARMLLKDLLWIRDRDGGLDWLGYLDWQREDIIVPAEGRVPAEREQLRRMLARWERALSVVLGGRAGEQAMAGNAVLRGRFLWEELAEPLWIRYGIWLDIGFYHVYLYLYQTLEWEERESLDRLLGIEGGHADWQMEEMAASLCRGAMEAVWLPRGDIQILTDMAEAGIKMLPKQWLSQQQVYGFYQSLCW